ncbi:MAG TPA: glycolate oxidase subunit GlcE [Reyranella sp.]|nr:glycolate oxidase subunit GlcE [Reyranella sp.]
MSIPNAAATSETALAGIVAEAYQNRTALIPIGGGSKAAIGATLPSAQPLDVSAISGISLYEPAEMVVGVRAGTSMAELEATLATNRQMLAFEPPDWRRLLGSEGTVPTVGGFVAANASGPRRVASGALRDALIGVRFVNGRGETIKSGGRVMKNVTGYDLVKLLAGSWGTLGIVTEAILKVLPKPETEASLAWTGLPDADAVALMSSALGSPFEVSAAAHLPAADDGASRTVLRLENFAVSVAYRSEEVLKRLKRFGPGDILSEAESIAFWRGIAAVEPLVKAPGAVWRASVAPSKAAALSDALRRGGAQRLFFDWGGGLIWLTAPETDPSATAIRDAARAAGGHAMLFRAGSDFRARIGAWAAKSGPLAALTDRIKSAFDPAGILNPGRMGT